MSHFSYITASYQHKLIYISSHVITTPFIVYILADISSLTFVSASSVQKTSCQLLENVLAGLDVRGTLIQPNGNILHKVSTLQTNKQTNIGRTFHKPNMQSQGVTIETKAHESELVDINSRSAAARLSEAPLQVMIRFLSRRVLTEVDEHLAVALPHVLRHRQDAGHVVIQERVLLLHEVKTGFVNLRVKGK